jgi:glyoxylase-like metal-dependent hydrolase (beta-lactamase superfamily II)
MLGQRRAVRAILTYYVYAPVAVLRPSCPSPARYDFCRYVLCQYLAVEPLKNMRKLKYALFVLCFLPLQSLAETLHLPATAVDTNDMPDMVFTGKEPDSQPLPYYAIAPDVYFLYGNIAEVDSKNRGFNGNAGFVVTKEGVVVVDSLGSPKLGRRLIATIRKVTSKPIKYLILTHNHPDHSYGAVAFRQIPGIRIIAHEGTMNYLASENLAHSVAYRKEIIPQDMQGFKAVKPDILVGGKEYSHHDFTLGGQTFVVYNVDSHHSFGDLVVYQPQQQILWISDLAFNNRTTFMGDGHSKNALAAMDWLKAAFPKAKLMVPGHGSAQTPPFPMVDKTYRYVQRLRDEMRKAVDEGENLSTAVSQSDFKDWHDSRLYEENHKKNASFVYQEMEQEVYFGK